MSRAHMIHLSDAISLCERREFIAKRSREGRALHVYTGDAADPGTWMEVGKMLIDDADCVTRHALALALGDRA